jgi:molybdopterin-binding protein
LVRARICEEDGVAKLVNTYGPQAVAELLGVSVDTVRRWSDSGRLPTRRGPRGQRIIEGTDLVRFLETTPRAPEPETFAGQSARNRFTGVVTKVTRDAVAATVEIQAGPHRVVSLMTAEAVEELGLAPGVLAVAAVKATNVVVEVPAE